MNWIYLEEADALGLNWDGLAVSPSISPPGSLWEVAA
jgi:hypothetical protein